MTNIGLITIIEYRLPFFHTQNWRPLFLMKGFQGLEDKNELDTKIIDIGGKYSLLTTACIIKFFLGLDTPLQKNNIEKLGINYIGINKQNHIHNVKHIDCVFCEKMSNLSQKYVKDCLGIETLDDRETILSKRVFSLEELKKITDKQELFSEYIKDIEDYIQMYFKHSGYSMDEIKHLRVTIIGYKTVI